MTAKLRYGRFATAVFVSTFFAITPQSRADLPEGSDVRVSTMVIQAVPGVPDSVPYTVPEEYRGQVQAIVAAGHAGQVITLISPEAAAQGQPTVERAVRDGGQIIPNFWPLLIVILVIVVVAAVIIGGLIHMINQIPPSPTNLDESQWTNGIGITRPVAFTGPIQTITNEASTSCLILEGCTNLAEGVWFTLCTMTASSCYSVTNMTPAMEFATVDVRGPQGQWLGQAVASGIEQDMELLLPRTAPIHIPAPNSPVMFLRTITQ